MSSATRVGVKELKNRLSAYLREVRKGRRILVTDRGEVIAELHQAPQESQPEKRAIEEWLQSGDIVLPARQKLPLPAPLVHLPAGTSQELLDELRGGD